MMRVFILSVLAFFLSSFVGMDLQPKKDLPFDVGEFFKFKINYSGFLNAGYATLELTEATYNKKSVFYAKGYGANSGLSKLFFKVEDHYQSYFDKETVKPYMTVRNISEGSYKRNQRAYFNHYTKKVLLRDLDSKKDITVDVPVDIQDVVSSFYYLRSYKGIDNLKEGETIDINMFFDDEIIPFKLKYIGKDNLKTKFGTIPSLIFRPMVMEGRVFKDQESLTVWVSADRNKVPLKIKASLAVGSINADLDQYRGLQFPLIKK